MIPTISTRDANNEQIFVKDLVYLTQYDTTTILHFKPCVIGKIVPALNEIQVVTHGPNGPQTLKVKGTEIYRNPILLLEKTLNDLNKFKTTIDTNIQNMNTILKEAKNGKQFDLPGVESSQETTI